MASKIKLSARPWVIILLLVTGIVAVVLVAAHQRSESEALDNTEKLFGKGFGDMNKGAREARKDAAEAQADFDAWLKRLNGRTNN